MPRKRARLPSGMSNTPETWAEVRAHHRVTRYRRSGAGRALLLLGSNELWPELLDALHEAFRLIVPEVPPQGADAADWLADFMEGLGMPNVCVVASDELALPALELARRCADQFARVVVVTVEVGEECVAKAIEAEAPSVSTPLLVVPRSQSADEAIPVITRFLGGG